MHGLLEIQFSSARWLLPALINNEVHSVPVKLNCIYMKKEITNGQNTEIKRVLVVFLIYFCIVLCFCFAPVFSSRLYHSLFRFLRLLHLFINPPPVSAP